MTRPMELSRKLRLHRNPDLRRCRRLVGPSLASAVLAVPEAVRGVRPMLRG